MVGLLGPAAAEAAGIGEGCFWITLNERDGEAGTSLELVEGGDGVVLAAATGAGSATACG